MKHIDESVPCYNCTKRSVGCHSTCEEYIAFDQANRARTEQIRRKRYEDNMMYEVKVRALKKINKEKHI